MAKNVLFLIHGVGRHGDDWADAPDGPIAALETAAKSYKFFEGKELRKLVDIVPIRYDDLFDRILDRWQDLANDLKFFPAADAAPEALEATLGLLRKVSDKKELLVSSGADVPLYSGFRLFRQRIQLRVIQRIAHEIAARNAAASGMAPNFVVLAHSLGTTVAHDSLQLLGSTDWLKEDIAKDASGAAAEAETYRAAHKKLLGGRGIKNPFAPGFASFRSVYMISNTSPLLQTTCAPESSIVCPIKVGGAPAAYCDRFFNVDHVLDPISKLKRFALPPAWGDRGANIVVDHFYDPNVHAFSHYLLHPKVNVELFMDLFDGFEPTDAENLRDENFARIGGKVLAAAEDARHRVETRLKEIVAEALAPAEKELARLLAARQALADVIAEGI